MMFWDAADDARIDLFSGIKRRNMRSGRKEGASIYLRLERDDLERGPQKLKAELIHKIERATQIGGRIAGVFIFNEEDRFFDFRWRLPNGKAPDWGNQRPANDPATRSPLESLVADIARVVDYLDLRDELPDRAPVLISPAYIMRGFTEDDPPDPGLFTWREITAPLFYDPDGPVTGNGVHFYDYGWWERDPPPVASQDLTSPDAFNRWFDKMIGARLATFVNVSRFKQAVRFWSGFHHHLTYWDESNTENEDQDELWHMEACVGKAKLLIHSKSPQGYVLGERVALFTPFTSNGVPNAYPAQFIMRDRRCYDLVRVFMRENGAPDE
jgi:hypothetical protein